MKTFSLRLFLAALTFSVGVSAAAFLTFPSYFPLVSVERVEMPAAKSRSAVNELDEIFYALRSDNNTVRNNAVRRIYEILNTNAERRRLMTVTMTGETSRLCMNKDLSSADFDVIQIIAPILAELQATEALDMLIDCSDKSLPFSEAKINYATIPGIIKYGQSAIPMLEGRLNEFGNRKITYQIAVMLTAIDGKRARQILNKTAQEITGRNASRYFKNSAEDLNSPDTEKYTKLRIADELTIIGGNKAERILSDAIKNQTDEQTADYLNLCLMRSRNVAHNKYR